MAVHRNDGATLDSQLNLGERIVDALMSEVGAAEASERLKALAMQEKHMSSGTDVHTLTKMAHSLVSLM